MRWRNEAQSYGKDAREREEKHIKDNDFEKKGKTDKQTVKSEDW